jgi:hypothetical protein
MLAQQIITEFSGTVSEEEKNSGLYQNFIKSHEAKWPLEFIGPSKSRQDKSHPQRIRPCDLQKLIKSLKLREVCGIDGITNECLRHLLRRPLVYLTHLFNHCLRLSHFPYPWKEAEIITLPKPGKDPKFPQNLRPISLLSTTGKLFEKAILKILQKHI